MKDEHMPSETEIAIARYCKLLEQTIPLAGKREDVKDAQGERKEVPLYAGGEGGSQKSEEG